MPALWAKVSRVHTHRYADNRHTALRGRGVSIAESKHKVGPNTFGGFPPASTFSDFLVDARDSVSPVE